MSTDREAQPAPGASAEPPLALHFGIAEQGKLYALAGRHALALAYYREAIRLTVQAGDPEIVFRHYLECVLESLEQMDAYADVLDYCDKAIGLLRAQEAAAGELAHVYQRQGAVLLKRGERDAAAQALRRALDLADTQALALPLARTLLGWVERGLQVDGRRVLAEQRHARYFNVRPETVDGARAVKLPNEHLLGGVTSATATGS